MSLLTDAFNKVVKETGGYLADRTGWDGSPPTLPMPNIPAPGERSFLPVFTEKFTETLDALPDFLEHHGRSLEGAWKGLWSGLEYPERTFNEAWGGGNWINRFASNPNDALTEATDEFTSLVASTVNTDGNGNGNNNNDNDGDGDGTTLSSREEERARMDAIRRMLAGRYGRGETNLTGGSGYGTGQSRGLGGY